MALLGRSALGLDVGSHSIKAVAFRQSLRSLEVGAMHAMPTEDPGDPRSLAERLRSFLRTHKLPTEHVVCAIAGDKLTGRRLTFPFRDRRRLAQAIPFAVEDEVPFELEQIVMDWEFVGGDRNEARIAATVAPRAEVARVLDLLAEAGADPRVVEAEGLALGNLSGFFALPGTRVVADCGHRKTTVCLCIDGEPVAWRSIPLGGGALTRALAEQRGVSLAEAERVKCEEGVAGASPGAALDVVDRLAREVVRSFGSFEPVLAEFGSARVDAVTLVGGGAHLHGLDRYLADRLGVSVERIALPGGDAGKAFLAGGDPSLFAPAAALALRGTSQARTRTNFRQDEFARSMDVGRIGRELATTGVLAATALVLAGVLAVTSIVLQSRRAEAVEAQVQQLYTSAFPGGAAPSNPIAAMRDAVRSAHDRADFLGVYRGNLSALDLLQEISARVPKDLQVVFEGR